MDKGNNSEENIQLASQKHKMTIVGSLVPSQHKELVQKPMTAFQESFKNCPVYREERKVFGIPAVVAVTFHEKLQRKQLRRLKEKLARIEATLHEAFSHFKEKESKSDLQKRLKSLVKGSGLGRCIEFEIGGRRYKTLQIRQVVQKIREKKEAAGKTIHFSTEPGMRSEEIISLYRSRDKVEKTFRLEKDPKGIPFRPIYCWTDSKIRVYAFICVLALLIWRVMQYKLRQVGLKMSDGVLRKELEDIKEAVVMYSPNRVVRKIAEHSMVQKEIIGVLGLHRYFPKG